MLELVRNMGTSSCSDVGDIRDIELKMKTVVETFTCDLLNIHTVRPSVDYMNKMTITDSNKCVMLRSVAVVSVLDVKVLAIEFFGKDVILKFDKKIRECGLKTQVEGKIIKVSYIDMVEERRSRLTKEISNLEEHKKIMLRALRQEYNNKIRKLFKDKNDDNVKSLTKRVQVITDLFVGQISVISKNKRQTLQ